MWGWSSHPQFGLQDLVKVEQPWLFVELTGCQAGFQLPPVTLTTPASALLGPSAKPQAPRGSSTCTDQRTPQHSSPSNGASGLQGNHVMFRTQSQSWPAPPGFQPLFQLYLESFRKLVQKKFQASFILGFSISLKSLKTREKSISPVLKFN